LLENLLCRWGRASSLYTPVMPFSGIAGKKETSLNHLAHASRTCLAQRKLLVSEVVGRISSNRELLHNHIHPYARIQRRDLAECILRIRPCRRTLCFGVWIMEICTTGLQIGPWPEVEILRLGSSGVVVRGVKSHTVKPPRGAAIVDDMFLSISVTQHNALFLSSRDRAMVKGERNLEDQRHRGVAIRTIFVVLGALRDTCE
jgi:hypothetical protein